MINKDQEICWKKQRSLCLPGAKAHRHSVQWRQWDTDPGSERNKMRSRNSSVYNI